MSKRFKCPFNLCAALDGYDIMQSFNSHLWRTHDKDRKCPVCNDVFEEVHQLFAHVRGHVAPGHVQKKVHNFDQPVYQALTANTNRKLKDDSRIIQMFTGVCNIMKSKETLDYDDFVIVMHPNFKIPRIAFECVRFQDIHGEGEPASRRIKGTSVEFILDPYYNKRNQSCKTEYDGSGYQRAHVVSLFNYPNNKGAFLSTMSATNNAPAPNVLNKGPLDACENYTRNLVRNNGRALIITVCVLPERKKDMHFLVPDPAEGKKYKKEKELSVAIPIYFGKIGIIRNRKGLHVFGWKFLIDAKLTVKQHSPAEERLAPFLSDPFTLAADAGFPLLFNKSVCSTVNGKSNHQMIEDQGLIFPLYKEYFDFIQTFKETETGSGPSEAKQAKIETVTLDSDDD